MRNVPTRFLFPNWGEGKGEWQTHLMARRASLNSAAPANTAHRYITRHHDPHSPLSPDRGEGKGEGPMHLMARTARRNLTAALLDMHPRPANKISPPKCHTLATAIADHSLRQTPESVMWVK